MKKIPLSQLSSLFSAISQLETLYIPADDSASQAHFTPWVQGMELTKKGNTARSPKDLFFPQVEGLVNFKVSGKSIEILENRPENAPFVVFGVRACDCRSFYILDRVFLTEQKDTFYESRRKAATIVTLACTHPAETCFCGSFGIDPTDPKGDVSCWIEEDFLYWRANTEKGQALTDKLPMLVSCDDLAVKARQARTKEILKRLPIKLDLEGFDREHMLSLFNAPQWDSLSESCLGCGTCTFVCPTCQCYDVQEFNDGEKIRRFRCWDSCMYADFTLMSAGQPRPTQKERFRQRFMHKLCYFPNNNDGLFGCTGCGRCLQKCPIHMNIVKVANTLKEVVK